MKKTIDKLTKTYGTACSLNERITPKEKGRDKLLAIPLTRQELLAIALYVRGNSDVKWHLHVV